MALDYPTLTLLYLNFPAAITAATIIKYYLSYK